MNKNIEVINESLWVVDFDHIKMGWIKDISFNNPNPSDYATFTKDGKIVLNKNKPIYKVMTRYLSIIMKMHSNHLASDKGFYRFIRSTNPETKKFSNQAMKSFIEKEKLHSVRQLFFNLSSIEKERRRIQELFNKEFNQLRKGV